MYNSTSIQTLIDRVGWAQAVQPNSQIVVDAANLTANSGRFFKDFHPNAIVELVVPTMPNPSANAAAYNAYLLDMKRIGVLKVLTAVFDLNERAQFTWNATRTYRTARPFFDYSDTIITRSNLFDTAIGYQVALDALAAETLSIRNNGAESKMKESYTEMKIEMGDFNNADGNLVSGGLTAKLNDAIIKIIDILFPEESIKRPYLRGVHIW